MSESEERSQDSRIEPPLDDNRDEPNLSPNDAVSTVDSLEPEWHRWVRRALLGATILAPIIFLASWSYADTSRDFCGGCHTVEAAAASHVSSIHAEVPCLSCHHRSGFIGAMTYYPTLIRETVHEATGLPVARDVLQPKPCATCHKDIAELDAHQGSDLSCTGCHGEVAHPGIHDVATLDGHQSGYFLVHGRDAAADSGSCSECHNQLFCRACHVTGSFPHPDTWITEHGQVTVEAGTASCDSCHPVSYCGGCHGTDIPHPPGWLGQHHRSDYPSISACTTCHAVEDCTVCHLQHGVHREQRLYDLEPEL